MGAIILCAAIVAGCGDGGGSSNADGVDGSPIASTADRYGYDLATASLTPVYELVPEHKDIRDDYARDLLAQRCLEGVVDYTPITPDVVSPFSDYRTGQRVFNEEIAAQWGYSATRVNPLGHGPLPPGVTVTPAIDEAMRECGRETDERLGQPPQMLLGEIEAAGWDALSTSEELDAAAAAWRSCMAPAGVVDLPLRPSGTASPSVSTPGAMVPDAQGNLQSDANVAPSEREIEVAVADARCREESGYTATELRVRAEAELEAIGRNLEAFDAVRDDYQQYARGIDDVIAELG
ncbi:MAG: hypothetical protein JJE52_16730 [Acidimicrobiia bacterium]|nr:hypothetical protein [Acidimicrobiia bacterium]